MKAQRSSSKATSSTDVSKEATAESTAAPESELAAQTDIEALRAPRYDLPANDARRSAVAGQLQATHGNAAVQRLLSPGGKTDGGVPAATSEAIESERGRGDTLPAVVRSEMEPALGRDFGGVRVHTGTTADHLASGLQARAFTSGMDVFFRDGAYDPASTEGRQTLAHELTHVAQNDGSAPAANTVSQPQDAGEQQATAVAETLTSGGLTGAVAHEQGAGISREVDPLSAIEPQGDNIKAVEEYMANAEARQQALDEYGAATFQLAEKLLTELTTLSGTYGEAYRNFTDVLANAEMQAANQQYYTDIVISVVCGFLASALAAFAIPAGGAVVAAGLTSGELLGAGASAVAGTAGAVASSKVLQIAGKDLDSSALDATVLENKLLKQVLSVYRSSDQFDSYRSELGDRALKLSKFVTTMERYEAGKLVDITPEEIDAEVETLAFEDEDSMWINDELPGATATLQEALTAAGQINAAQYSDVDIERTLWVVWIAGLPDDANILDLPAIEDHLASKRIKLASFGSGYTFDVEENDAIAKARELAATIKDDPQSFAMANWDSYALYFDQAGWPDAGYAPYEPTAEEAAIMYGISIEEAMTRIQDGTLGQENPPNSTPLVEAAETEQVTPEHADAAGESFMSEEPNSSEQPAEDALGPLDEDL